ncbi:hypothetical protein HUJ05_003941 [Dendroctonus ponderosae]|nr:hypothetical protein HUJ05_003941 [Dendroctonus ponderosae]
MEDTFIPSWALGSRGCLLTELPSLTVLYIPEQSALELTSDCGLDGTKRIACKGNADHEEMLKQLTCVIAHEDMDDERTSKTSVADYFESSTWADTDGDGTATKNWNLNTVNPEHLTSTRHRRETEDTLSPVATKSSFKEISGTNISWQDQHEDKVVLTTQHILLESHVSPTPATTSNIQKLADGADLKITGLDHDDKRVSTEFHKEVDEKLIHTSTEQLLTTPTAVEVSSPSPKPTEELTKSIPTLKTDRISESPKASSWEATSTTTMQEGNVEDYPSAISQGQLFSIIENGTMFDVIELNETEQQLLTSKSKIVWPASTTGAIQSTTTQSSIADGATKLPIPTKKPVTKKPIPPTKKAPKMPYKKDMVVKHLLEAPTTSRIRSVDEMEEQLTKEFDMMPDISDTSLRLNRTFRKELPPIVSEEEPIEHASLEKGSQYGVPSILNFTAVNAVDKDEAVQGAKDTNSTETVAISDRIEPLVAKQPVADTAANASGDTSNYRLVETAVTEVEKVVAKKPLVTASLPEDNIETSRKLAGVERNPIDPRLYMLNQHPALHPNNHNDSPVLGSIAKEEFLPKSLIGDKQSTPEPPAPSDTSLLVQTSDGDSQLPFPSEAPKKKKDRHLMLHNTNVFRKFYPYLFSRMLG